MNKEKAFTLAEVLITLVIIGVVAAITVPMLMNNTNDKQWNVARQKAKATIGEAFRLMTVNNEITDTLSTQEFVEQVIPKYLKITKTCNNAKDCGFSDKVKRAVDGVSVALPTSWSTSTNPIAITAPPTVAAQYTPRSADNPTTQNFNNSYFFQTLDGYSVNFFYNPYCAKDMKDKSYFYYGGEKSYEFTRQLSLDTICFNAVYDMNGSKGPNTVGKDVGFVGSFYNGYGSVSTAVLPYNKMGKITNFTNDIPDGNNYSLAAYNYCNNLGNDNNWDLPDMNELSLIFLNRSLIIESNNSTDSSNSLHSWFASRTSNHLGSYPIMNVLLSVGERCWGTTTGENRSLICVRKTKLK